jgi:hypothetical protein
VRDRDRLRQFRPNCKPDDYDCESPNGAAESMKKLFP